VSDWTNRLSRLPVIGYAAKVLHDLSLLPVLRRDILAEVARERRRIDGAEQALGDCRGRIEGLPALDQKTGALAQHISRLLELQSATESRFHELERKLGDLDLVVNSLPGALREARRSDRATMTELETVRSDVRDSARLITAFDSRLLSLEALLAAWDKRIEHVCLELERAKGTAAQSRADAEAGLAREAAASAAQERVDRAIEQWQQRVSELSLRLEDVTERLGGAERAALARAVEFDELKGRLLAIQEAHQQSLAPADGDMATVKGELSGRLDTLSERLVAAEETILRRGSDMREIDSQLKILVRALDDVVRQTSAEVQGIERSFAELRQERIRGAHSGAK
jgi:chromosome segregation ATPase